MRMVPLWLASSTGSDAGQRAAWRAVPQDGTSDRPADASVLAKPGPGGPLLVEAHDVAGVASIRDDWTALAGRCLEPNVFLEPDFCLSIAQHVPPARQPLFILVWAPAEGATRTLLAVCPLARPTLPVRALAANWFHELSALAGPLLDRDHAGPALEAILAHIGHRHPGCAGWLIPSLATDGATARAITALAARTARPVHWLDPCRRAVLRRSGAGAPAGLAAVSRKKAKDMRRQRRGLEALGTVGYETATGDDVRDALERFLVLESQGWKGRRGTALLMLPEQAAFARTMTRLLARDGRCRIDSLTLDGEPLAMGIVLSSGGHDYFWKMTYDEAHAGASPGVQFVLALTERQQRADRVEVTDSCAMPDHAMIDHLWRDRKGLADALVSVSSGPTRLFDAAVALERFRRRTRAGLKRMVLALRARTGRSRRVGARPTPEP